MFWGGAVFTTGWILRCISSYEPSNLNVYIAQTVFIYAGPPIYSAAEYNVLGRLMLYLPMHAPLNPNRIVYLFIYLGATVEGLTAAGASLYATASGVNEIGVYKTGGVLISVSLVLQAAIELGFISLVALMHHRAARSKMLTPNVRKLCIMLYGTSAFVLLRCIARAIENFGTLPGGSCSSLCRGVLLHEWYLYAFEAAPMVMYTYWMNVVHPGRLLPRQKNRYLDINGKTEHLGPGWIDERPKWETYADPFAFGEMLTGRSRHEAFWLRPEDWAVAGERQQCAEGNSDGRR